VKGTRAVFPDQIRAGDYRCGPISPAGPWIVLKVIDASHVDDKSPAVTFQVSGFVS
jgi:hypothetical protein